MLCVTLGNGSPQQTESLQTAWAPRQPAALPPGTFRQIRGSRRVALWNCVRRKTPSSIRTSEPDLSVCFHLWRREKVTSNISHFKTYNWELYQNYYWDMKFQSLLWALWLVTPPLCKTVTQKPTATQSTSHCTMKRTVWFFFASFPSLPLL